MTLKPHLRILSLGAGVQSTTVLLMSCHGELPPLDAAIFADTGWEPRAVYRHLDWLIEEAAHYGIPVHVVSAGNIKQDALENQVRGYAINGKRWASMPYFVLGPNGEKGMIRRQCTIEYKLRPLRQKTRELAGFEPRERIPAGYVQRWIAISADERRRQRESGVRWCFNWYPLVERGITRWGCLEWMRNHGYPDPPRSACIGCPYHRDAEWRWLRDNEPESFEEACRFDEAIRKCGGMKGDLFLHSQRIPLAEVDLRTDIDRGQLKLFL